MCRIHEKQPFPEGLQEPQKIAPQEKSRKSQGADHDTQQDGNTSENVIW